MTTDRNVDVHEIGRGGTAPPTEPGRSSEDSEAEDEVQSQPGVGRRLRLGLQNLIRRVLAWIRGVGGREIGPAGDGELRVENEGENGDLFEQREQTWARATTALLPDARPPVEKLCDLILLSALTKGATNIYIETTHGNFTVTYRLHSHMAVEMTPHFKLAAAVTNRMKEMAQLDLNECRVSQEGQIVFNVGQQRRAAFRLETVPSVYGDDLVLDVLYDRKLLSVCD